MLYFPTKIVSVFLYSLSQPNMHAKTHFLRSNSLLCESNFGMRTKLKDISANNLLYVADILDLLGLGYWIT